MPDRRGGRRHNNGGKARVAQTSCRALLEIARQEVCRATRALPPKLLCLRPPRLSGKWKNFGHAYSASPCKIPHPDIQYYRSFHGALSWYVHPSSKWLDDDLLQFACLKFLTETTYNRPFSGKDQESQRAVRKRIRNRLRREVTRRRDDGNEDDFRTEGLPESIKESLTPEEEAAEMVSPLTPYEEASEFLDELLGACDEFPGNSTAEASPVEFAAAVNEGIAAGKTSTLPFWGTDTYPQGTGDQEEPIFPDQEQQTFPDRLLRAGNFGHPTAFWRGARKLIDVDLLRKDLTIRENEVFDATARLDPLRSHLLAGDDYRPGYSPSNLRVSDRALKTIAQKLDVDKAFVSDALKTIKAKAKRRKKPSPIDVEELIRKLDDREKGILCLSLQGFEQKEIENKLGCAQSTVSRAKDEIGRKSRLLSSPPKGPAPPLEKRRSIYPYTCPSGLAGDAMAEAEHVPQGASPLAYVPRTRASSRGWARLERSRSALEFLFGAKRQSASLVGCKLGRIRASACRRSAERRLAVCDASLCVTTRRQGYSLAFDCSWIGQGMIHPTATGSEMMFSKYVQASKHHFISPIRPSVPYFESHAILLLHKRIAVA